MTARPDLSIVIVSRDVRELLVGCLTSIERQRNSSAIEVIVVDAASKDGSPAMVAERFPWVRLLGSTENLGFTRGNNWALRLARGRHVLLLNPDTVVGEGALAEMVGHMDRHHGVGAIAPKLLHPDGSVQSSRRRFPRRLTAFVESTVLERWRVGSRLIGEFRFADRADDQEHDVDWAMGAALAIRSDVLRQVGLLDERFFMYSEEVDLCWRIRAAGWRIVYLPSATVVHHEGRSSQQDVTSRNLYFHESRFRYYAKHFGRAWALALRLAILAHFTIVGAEEAAKLALGSRRQLRRERLTMVRRVLHRQIRDLASAVGS